jgi:cell division protein FtsN
MAAVCVAPEVKLSRIPSLRRQAGGTFLGILIGLVAGLTIAALVALFITKAPVPFVNKTGTPRPGDVAPPPGATLPDPNKILFGKDGGAGAANAAAATSAADGSKPEEKRFSFYNVAPPAVPAVVPGAAPAAVPGAPVPADGAKPSAMVDDGKSRFLLQAGAFKNESDAEAMKARLALLGLTAEVSDADRDGTSLHRVRVGPIARLEDVTRMKQTLGQNGIDATVIKLP